MTQEKPAAVATTNTTPGSCVDVPCTPKRKVTYKFIVTSKRDCKLPYAVAIDGKTDPRFKQRALALLCDSKQIEVFADAGQKIALYLNSDAHPDYRTTPVYEVTVGDFPIEVTVTEKAGKHSDAATVTLKETKGSKDAKTGATLKTQVYAAPLTGDIWLSITHKYTADEAKTLIPADTPKEISAAVLKFYDGSLSAAANKVAVSAPKKSGTGTHTTTVAPNPGEAMGNVHANIQVATDIFKDVLPRVHPGGYVALFQAALEAEVGTITLNSTWRPMMGSIAHRAGLGLDVGYLDQTHLNREELRGKKPTAAADANVSDEEKKLFKAHEEARAERDKAIAHKEALDAELKQLEKLKTASSTKFDAARYTELEKEIPAATQKAKDATRDSQEKLQAWNDERNKNEPAKVKTYRTSLSQCKCVKQLFDPWYMDGNTQDKIPAVPNEQRKSKKNEETNETLHAHHLHITVDEPKILGG